MENNIDIEQKALNGNVKDAWENLMEKVGLEYKDVPEADILFYETASLSSSGKMNFVNDVLPNEILARDDSKETRRLTAVLIAVSKAYNFSDNYSSFQIAKCAQTLEKAVSFFSPELQAKAYGAAADLYGRKKSHENDAKQAECLLKALDLAPTQTEARLYAERYLFQFTKGGYEHKVSYQPEALDKEIELYEKVLEKVADDPKVESYLHNELSKGYSCKAKQAIMPSEQMNLEMKAKQHKTKVLPLPLMQNCCSRD